MNRISLSERRSVLARLTLDLTNKKGPLSDQERVRLRAYQREMDQLEEDLVSDEGHKRYQRFQRAIRRPGEYRDMFTTGEGTGAASGGGVLVPVQFESKVTAALKYAGPMVDDSIVTMVTTDRGGNRAFPSDNDTADNALLVPEGSQVSAVDIANMSQVILGQYKVGTGLLTSNELADDAGVDMESYLADRFGRRIGRLLNQLFTTGTGSSQPTGFVTAATVAGTAVGAVANDGVSAANSLGTADFATLEASVDQAYRPNAKWMVHPATLQKLRGQLDKEGRPVFAGLSNSPDGVNRIFNHEVLVNPAMDQLQVNSSSPTVTRKVLAYGDWSYYVARKIPSRLVVLVERFVDSGKSGWILWGRYDGNIVDGGGGAIKVLQTVY